MDIENRILRCDSCQHLVHSKVLATIGCCHNCGNRRYKSVGLIKEDEYRALSDGTYDLGMKDVAQDVGEFLQLFEQVEEDE